MVSLVLQMVDAPHTAGHRGHMGVYQDWWAGGLFTCKPLNLTNPTQPALSSNPQPPHPLF